MYTIPLASDQLVPADLTRLQFELDQARRIQFSLLPKTPPLIPGLDLWGVFQPATHVGGDFFDFITHPDQSLTFLIGDVSGKGLPAAMLMTMTRAILRAEADSSFAPSPETILRNANAKLLDDFVEAGMFVTAFVGQYHPCSRELLYANAGHSPVIFRPAGERPRLLEADGTALGVLQDTFSQNHRIRLAQGDLLVAATDGLIDATDQRCVPFGLTRLLNQMYRPNGQSASQISSNLLMSVRDFSAGKPQTDDQTVIVLLCID